MPNNIYDNYNIDLAGSGYNQTAHQALAAKKQAAAQRALILQQGGDLYGVNYTPDDKGVMQGSFDKSNHFGLLYRDIRNGQGASDDAGFGASGAIAAGASDKAYTGHMLAASQLSSNDAIGTQADANNFNNILAGAANNAAGWTSNNVMNPGTRANLIAQRNALYGGSGPTSGYGS